MRLTQVLFSVTLVVASATWAETNADDTPFGRRFHIKYEKSSHFWNRTIEVRVDGEANGIARLVFTGDKRGEPWNEEAIDHDCRLERRLVGELRVALQH